MAAGSALRLAHTAVLTAVCIVVSGLGHSLAAGSSPPLWAYALAAPPLCAAAWRLTRTERSAGVSMAASAAGQLALHVYFGLLPHGTAHPTATHSGHRPEAPQSLWDSGVVASLTSQMAGAHLLAGAVCGWWLWRGERALVQLVRARALFTGTGTGTGGRLRFALALLVGFVAPPPAVRIPTRRADSSRRRPPASLVPLRALAFRGPPLLPS